MAGEADRTSGSHAAATRLLLFGPPGSGKGTQAALLAARLGVPAISTGEMLRAAVAHGSELGRKVDGIMCTGALVDDVTMQEVVRERLAAPDAVHGFLLDGYPRNAEQAATLEEILDGQGVAIDAAVFLDVPEEELVRRMTGRKAEAGRADDDEQVVRERLRIYREKTAPLVGYYEQRGTLRHIDGFRSVEAVTEAIVAALDGPANASRRVG